MQSGVGEIDARGKPVFELFEKSPWISLYSRKLDDFPFKLVLAQSTLPVSPAAAVDAYYGAEENLLEWDKATMDIQILEEERNENGVVYERVVRRSVRTPTPLVSNRDFVYRHSVTMLNDGSFLCIAGSVEHPDAPEEKRFTRGCLHYSCALFQVDPNDANQTRVYNLFLVDPRGLIPPMIVNMAGSKFADAASDFARYVHGRNASMELANGLQPLRRPHPLKEASVMPAQANTHVQQHC